MACPARRCKTPGRSTERLTEEPAVVLRYLSALVPIKAGFHVARSLAMRTTLGR